jgi:hypothetical protein
MIFSSDDLPVPLRPSTPILAPGRNARVTSLTTVLSGGNSFVRRCIVKMY